MYKSNLKKLILISASDLCSLFNIILPKILQIKSSWNRPILPYYFLVKCKLPLTNAYLSSFMISIIFNLFFVERGIGFDLFFTAVDSTHPGRLPTLLFAINNDNLIIFSGVEFSSRGSDENGTKLSRFYVDFTSMFTFFHFVPWCRH